MEQILNKILDKLNSIEDTQKSIVSEVASIKENQTSTKLKIDKNSFMLEKIQTHIWTLAEVQYSFSEQLDRTKNKDGKTLGERLDLIELAITNTSKCVNNVVNAVEKLKNTTSAHDLDINVLKKLKHNVHKNDK